MRLDSNLNMLSPHLSVFRSHRTRAKRIPSFLIYQCTLIQLKTLLPLPSDREFPKKDTGIRAYFYILPVHQVIKRSDQCAQESRRYKLDPNWERLELVLVPISFRMLPLGRILQVTT